MGFGDRKGIGIIEYWDILPNTGSHRKLLDLIRSGGIIKKLEESRIYTLLFNLDTIDIVGPLTRFQATKFNKDDFKKLIKSINDIEEDSKLDDKVFDSVFEKWWPELESKIKEILKGEKSSKTKHRRTERDILEEILRTVRANSEYYENQYVPIEFMGFRAPKGSIPSLENYIADLAYKEMKKQQDEKRLLKLLKGENDKNEIEKVEDGNSDIK